MAHDLARLIVRHRHVAPMLSALLGGTQAAVRITDAGGGVLLERDTPHLAGQPDRFPILVEAETVGWVEGDRVARAVASVLSYAASREADKRSLAREALDRYRELNLVYDLAERLSAEHDEQAIREIAEEEAGRLVRGGRGILATGDEVGNGILAAVREMGVAEVVNDVAADTRADDRERAFTSLAAAPVTAHGQHLGALAVGTEAAHELVAAELKLLTAIAAIVGPVLERATRAAAVSGER